MPQINKKSQKLQRTEKIQDVLVEDAKRRVEKRQQQQKLSGRAEENKNSLLTKNSQKLVSNRFMDDYVEAIQHQGLEEGATLNYQTTVELIRNLGFLGNSPSFNPLTEELWKFVKTQEEREEGEQQQPEDPQAGSATLENIKVLLSAILQFNFPWMKPAAVEQEERPRINSQRIGVHEEGKYLVTDDEINWISKHFVLM